MESDEIAKSLVLDASRAIYGHDDFDMHRCISNNELEGVISLIRSIQPKDSLETLFAAQNNARARSLSLRNQFSWSHFQ